MTSEEDEKTVTIKGVRSDLFKKVKGLAYQSGKTMGDITNKAYETLVSSAQGFEEISKSFQLGVNESNAIIVENIKDISLSGEEIKKENKRILLRDIDSLKLSRITDEILDRYIERIINVKELQVEGSISKIKLLSKCENILKVSFS
ncbi:MAG: hypothetical protein JRN26_00620 [Nitrososphaerota archaeon]|jgi:hypothetical protein|nr:hypothetical protein [Nitrososphaerota archaeon]MDG6932085.1 hypothetical protein [Nitrososphaerota archaeon]MDG6935384.1 hypothetical protein [Nitrososphaerota archaeon]MDG6944475.1 hypothetical protein [Nitrososphaerota archaeon]